METVTTTKFKETEIGTIPEEWEVFPIGELVTIKGRIGWRGYTVADLKESGPLVIGGTQIVNNKLNFSKSVHISREKYEESPEIKISLGDIIVTKTGNSIGDVAIVSQNIGEATINPNVGLLKNINDKINSTFLYYWLIDNYAQNFLKNGSSASAQPAINQKTIGKLLVPFAPIKEQDKIAEILSSLDDKIELNKAINTNLEKIASSLFKRWFVDFEFPDENGKPYKSSGGKMVNSESGGIPMGWRIENLSNLVDNISERYIGNNENEKLPYVPIDAMSTKSLSLTSTARSEDAKSSLIRYRKNDILFGAMRPYFHKVSIAPFQGLTRTTCFVFRPKNDFYFAFSVLLIFQDETIDYANSNSEGSTIPYAKWNNSMENMPVVIPSDEIMKKFNDAIRPLLEKIKDSYFENKSLVKSRDSLLPRLMSGKIRVKT